MTRKGERMRIVMVSTGAPPDPYGGLGTYVEGLLGGLASQDAEVHLVVFSRLEWSPVAGCHAGLLVAFTAHAADRALRNVTPSSLIERAVVPTVVRVPGVPGVAIL